MSTRSGGRTDATAETPDSTVLAACLGGGRLGSPQMHVHVEEVAPTPAAYTNGRASSTLRTAATIRVPATAARPTRRCGDDPRRRRCGRAASSERSSVEAGQLLGSQFEVGR